MPPEPIKISHVSAALWEIEAWTASIRKVIGQNENLIVVGAAGGQEPADKAAMQKPPAWDSTMTVKVAHVCKALEDIKAWLQSIREVIDLGLDPNLVIDPPSVRGRHVETFGPATDNPPPYQVGPRMKQGC